MGQRAPATSAGKDAVRLRTPVGGAALSKAESTVRQLTQDWAVACNNKQLDDMLAFYSTDALVLRPNVPPVRGTAAPMVTVGPDEPAGQVPSGGDRKSVV